MSESIWKKEITLRRKPKTAPEAKPATDAEYQSALESPYQPQSEWPRTARRRSHLNRPFDIGQNSHCTHLDSAPLPNNFGLVTLLPWLFSTVIFY